eukprot:CAMPEP_0174972560 /NCGR_PEP_ID=MMETSP0004_2-20121128/10701_1 /TAXON_ID=420556 /ORGANISM="Ochromonas sp., Strain CCMP1393" /LENGTH=312 /DNA_ID=CAMNT_0016222805 /DNA_START=229 /DNA_END=1167 /DNA_ORIENTATION=-
MAALVTIVSLLPTYSAEVTKRKHFNKDLMGKRVYAHGIVFNPTNFLSVAAYRVLNGSLVPYTSGNVDCAFEVFGTGHLKKNESSIGYHDNMLFEYGTATMLSRPIISRGIQCQYRAIWVKAAKSHGSTMRWHFICYATKQQNLCKHARDKISSIATQGATFGLNIFNMTNRVFGTQVRGFDVGSAVLHKKNEKSEGGVREFYASGHANLHLVAETVSSSGRGKAGASAGRTGTSAAKANAIAVMPKKEMQFETLTDANKVAPAAVNNASQEHKQKTSFAAQTNPENHSDRTRKHRKNRVDTINRQKGSSKQQ